MKQTRRTKECWRELVARWRRSGAAATTFAKEVGIKASTLRWWAYELRRDTRAQHGSSSIVPIEIALPDTPSVLATTQAQLELEAGDVKVRFEVGTNVVYIAALARALRSS
jgi:hypothetical protein